MHRNINVSLFGFRNTARKIPVGVRDLVPSKRLLFGKAKYWPLGDVIHRLQT